MEWVGWRWEKVEVPVESDCRIAFRMDCEGTDACNAGGLYGASHRVLKKSSAKALTLPALAYREAREKHEGEPVGGVVISNLAHNEGVVSDDVLVV